MGAQNTKEACKSSSQPEPTPRQVCPLKVTGLLLHTGIAVALNARPLVSRKGLETGPCSSSGCSDAHRLAAKRLPVPWPPPPPPPLPAASRSGAQRHGGPSASTPPPAEARSAGRARAGGGDQGGEAAPGPRCAEAPADGAVPRPSSARSPAATAGGARGPAVVAASAAAGAEREPRECCRPPWRS